MESLRRERCEGFLPRFSSHSVSLLWIEYFGRLAKLLRNWGQYLVYQGTQQIPGNFSKGQAKAGNGRPTSHSCPVED